MNIFNKPYYSLRYFESEIFVKCPKCQGCSKITTTKSDSDTEKKSTLSCFNCGYVSNKELNWMGYYVGYIGSEYRGRACGFCGTKFNKEFKLTKKPYTTGTAICPNCNKEKEYKVKWYRFIGNLATDPFYGLDLYYQKTIKQAKNTNNASENNSSDTSQSNPGGNKVLWIYNIEHLNYLKAYISSNIRKRERVGLYSMIATLPNFIIEKKNKETILKQLNRFQEELIKN